MTAVLLDLDASRRETAHPDGIPVQFHGEIFTLPAELPADVFDPFLSGTFDIVAVAQAMFADDVEAVDGQAAVTMIDRLLGVLEDHPKIIADGFGAIKDSFRLLFGAAEYDAFVLLRPSFADYARLLKGLIGLYGVCLGEAFASPSVSVTAGPTPKLTASVSTSSTPDPFGVPPEPTEVFSESDV